MHQRIISVILIAFVPAFCSPDLVRGQSTDSLLYVIDNDLIEDDADKYDLLCELIKDIGDPESTIRYCKQAIELARQLDILPALPYYKKGAAYLYSDDFASALEFLLQAATY